MRCSRSALALCGLLLACAGACGPLQESLGDPGPLGSSSTMGGQGSSSSASASGSETGDPGPDMNEQCDPLADPVAECGADMRCDLDTLTCVAATGSAAVDEGCASTEDCLPGLACYLGYCADLCDDEGGEGQCEAGRVCVDGGGSTPGLCLSSCLLSVQDCALFDQGCNRATAAGVLVAVCTGNVGEAVEGEACSFDDDCDQGFLCTPAAAHDLGCIGEASACCSAVCETGVVGCFGGEMNCIELGITEQPDAGYCGV